MNLLFWKKSKAENDAQIEAIKQDTYEKIDKATQSLKKVNRVLDRNDVTLKIFYATGGERRQKHGR